MSQILARNIIGNCSFLIKSKIKMSLQKKSPIAMTIVNYAFPQAIKNHRKLDKSIISLETNLRASQKSLKGNI